MVWARAGTVPSIAKANRSVALPIASHQNAMGYVGDAVRFLSSVRADDARVATVIVGEEIQFSSKSTQTRLADGQQSITPTPMR